MTAKIVPSLILAAIFTITPTDCGRILAVMPTPSYSHHIVYKPLWLTLNSRGHHITLLTTDPINTSNLSNFRQVDWSFAYKLWQEEHNATVIINNYNTNIVKAFLQFTAMLEDIVSQELAHPQVQEIINNEDERFDLVIVEILHPVMVAFSTRFKCPFIGISPMDVTNFIHEGLGNPSSPALYTDWLSPFDGEMSFFERVVNTFYHLGCKMFLKYYVYPRMGTIARRFFGEDTPKLEEIERNASMVFLNINPIINDVRPMVSNVLAVGGGRHLESDNTLPPEIQSFLDGANTGAIYFSLGTNVKSKYLAPKIKTIFMEVFSELPYKVLWKFEDTTISSKSNIMVKPWLPQQQILKHPNVKLFITQGGLQSLEEAIYSAVPIIGLPVYVDQYPNVRKVIRMGIGMKLDYNKFDNQELKQCIIEVINNNKYKAAVTRLSVLLRERPISGLNQSVWWTEYVLRHKGAKFLKQHEIPLYQYLLLDVLAFLLLFNCILGYVFYKCFKYSIKFIKERRRGKRVKFE